MKAKKVHVMSNTHWDREHRHAFQETRIMLVQLIDELIEIMENDPEYKFFTLDGQSIVLHDYLEVKPYMKERITKLIKDGRILIGPWYSLVDCYSVNPESIIRNLLVGHRVCREFGEPMKLGYSIFSFGQMAQLPQVYAGFGIKDIVFYKGGSTKVFTKSEFIWKAPDGTEAFTTRLGKYKRWNFSFNFSIPVILGGNPKIPGWLAKFNGPGRLCHMNDMRFINHYSIELEPDTRIREEFIEKAVGDVIDSVSESTSENVFLAFDGTDFTSSLKDIPKALEIANGIMKGEVELVHSNPVEYFEDVKKDISLDSLIKYEGEMRFGPISNVHSETMGVNVEIKQALFNAENSIINYAEPLSAILKINGGKYKKDILDLAWRYLLAAQAHDSVHGAGDPKIKTDNLNRLAQVLEIANSITRRAVEGICSLIDMTAYEMEDILIAVFNTTPYKRSEVVRLAVDLPVEELVRDYRLEDMSGERMETYQLDRYSFNLAMIHRANRPKTVYCDRVELDAYIKDIPAMGFKLLKVKRVKGDPDAYQEPFPAGVFPYNPIGKPGNVLDNGLVRVTINNDGTIDILDYETGKIYGGLNYYTDTGCSGDFWVHREPANNHTITTKGGSCRISLVKNSGLYASCVVSMIMEIPGNLTENKKSRSSSLIPTEISYEVTLNKGSKRVDFKVKLNNKSKDHMLTVSFPVNIDTVYSYSECPFEIRKRNIDNSIDDFGKKGPELERHAMQNFIDISDGENGFALFTKGLKEFGTVRDRGPIINLTLLRAVSGTFPIHDDLFIGFKKETSQCLGEQTFEYSILLHKGDFEKGNVIEESRKYIIPPVSAEIGSGINGLLKEDISFVKIKGSSLILCAVKLAEDGDGIVIRLNNPTGGILNEELEFFNSLGEAYLTNMNEEPVERLEIKENRIALKVPPYKVITLYLKFTAMMDSCGTI